MQVFQSNGAELLAQTLTDLPNLADYFRSIEAIQADEDAEGPFPSIFNLNLLRNKQVAATQVAELTDLITEKGLPDFPIIFCHLDSIALAATYLEGEIPWSLMFIDISKLKSQDALRQAYLHEAAHLTANDQDHDFKFAAIHILYLYYAGYTQTQNDYDYRSCDSHGLTISEAKTLSSALAQYAVQQRIPVARAEESMLCLINSNGHIGSDGKTIIERYQKVLGTYV